jgi:hypothetical protein
MTTIHPAAITVGKRWRQFNLGEIRLALSRRFERGIDDGLRIGPGLLARQAPEVVMAPLLVLARSRRHQGATALRPCQRLECLALAPDFVSGTPPLAAGGDALAPDMAADLAYSVCRHVRGTHSLVRRQGDRRCHRLRSHHTSARQAASAAGDAIRGSHSPRGRAGLGRGCLACGSFPTSRRLGWR